MGPAAFGTRRHTASVPFPTVSSGRPSSPVRAAAAFGELVRRTTEIRDIGRQALRPGIAHRQRGLRDGPCMRGRRTHTARESFWKRISARVGKDGCVRAHKRSFPTPKER